MLLIIYPILPLKSQLLQQTIGTRIDWEKRPVKIQSPLYLSKDKNLLFLLGVKY